MFALLMDFAIQSPEVIRFLLSLVIGFLACLAMAYLLGWSHGQKAFARYPTLPKPPGYEDWERYYNHYLKHARMLRQADPHPSGPDHALASYAIDVHRAAEYADKALAVQKERYETQGGPRP